MANKKDNQQTRKSNNNNNTASVNDNSDSDSIATGASRSPISPIDEANDLRDAAKVRREEASGSEKEEEIHRQRHKARVHARKHRHCHNQMHHHQKQRPRGHVKELIKPDPPIKEERARIIKVSGVSSRSPSRSNQLANLNSVSKSVTPTPITTSPTQPRVVVAVDEEQLQQRLRESISEKKSKISRTYVQGKKTAKVGAGIVANASVVDKKLVDNERSPKTSNTLSKSTSSSSSSGSHSSSHDADDEIDGTTPPTTIIIPENVAKSLSNRANQPQTSTSVSAGAKSLTSSSSSSGPISPGAITREQLEYGPLLKPDRHLKEEQAKLVAPNLRQSPIAIMTMNPTYELQNKPLILQYPATVENLRLNNTGFSWEVKLPYQISMNTALYGAHLSTGHRYRLDQFHCHWGSDDMEGSEHTIDNKHYSAEIHFVHYNMEKYHSMSKAARHPDGLIVVSVFLEASDDHHNHAELEKIVSNLKHVPLKGDHSIIRQAVHIENLLPQNRSYWSYQGSLTTPPYFESVTWFIFKHPIKCNRNQIQRFRILKSSLLTSEDTIIESNHRKTQPLNGRTIVNYDDAPAYSRSTNSSARSLHR